jgi:3-deoxy-D-manno-octulosonate 8-phosphate phosphatase (KDO 8-P phosphatase)
MDMPRSDASRIRMIVSDMDGVWTDGRIIYTEDTRETKEFNVRDGLAVKIAQRAGIEVAVLTSRDSKAVARRCSELGIGRLVQGAGEKASALKKIANDAAVALEEILYIGDDLPDLAPMALAGLSAAPADAAAEVVRTADWRLDSRGGAGAIRELVERLLRERGEWDRVVAGFRAAKVDASGI